MTIEEEKNDRRGWPESEPPLSKEEGRTAEAFKEKLAVEIIARFTGNSRGTPIAKQGFVDGALWAASQFKSPSPVQTEEVGKYTEKDLKEVCRQQRELCFEAFWDYSCNNVHDEDGFRDAIKEAKEPAICSGKEEVGEREGQEDLMYELLNEYTQMRKRKATPFSIRLCLCDKFTITRKGSVLGEKEKKD